MHRRRPQEARARAQPRAQASAARRRPPSSPAGAIFASQARRGAAGKAHRLGDVLEALRPEVGHLKLEPRLDLPVGVFGQTNPARLANPFQPGRDVHAVAHEVAVRFLDDVPKMNADAKLDTTFGRKASVALDHASLHLE